MCICKRKFIKQPDIAYMRVNFHNRSLLWANVICHYDSIQVNATLKRIPNSILTTIKLTAINSFNFTYQLQPEVKSAYINKPWSE